MIETEYGPINDTMKIWGRVWEVYPGTGFIRVLKDPCTPDPVAEIPYTTAPFGIYNDYDEDIYQAYVIGMADGDTAIDLTWYGTPAYETETGFLVWEDGYDSSMITEMIIFVQWDDGEFGAFYDYPPYSWNPYNYTVYPNS